MARAKKSTSKKSTQTSMIGDTEVEVEGPKVNKTAWIRKQPSDMSAKEVVEKAAEEGITLSPAQVYTARSTEGKSKPKSKKSRIGNPKREFLVAVAEVGGPDVAEQFLSEDSPHRRLIEAVDALGGEEPAMQLLEGFRELMG